MMTASWVLQRAASRRAAVLGGGAARLGAGPDRLARRRLRVRLWLRRRHRRCAAVVHGAGDGRASRTRSTSPSRPRASPIACCIPASRSTSTASAATIPTSAWSIGPAAIRSTITRTPTSCAAPGRSPRPSWSTSRGGPRPRATPTSCCRRPRRWSATTSAARARDRFIIAMQQAIEPVGEARNDFDIFSALAQRLGIADAYTQGRDEMAWLRHLYEQMRQSAGANAAGAAGLRDVLAERLSGNPGGRRGIRHLRRLPRRPRQAQAPHPVRQDRALSPRRSRASATTIARRMRPGSSRGNGSAAPAPRPIRCIWSRASRATGCTARWITGRSAPAARSPAVRRSTINPADAEARGIRDGDVVRVHNSRGACLAGAIVSDTISAGVVQLSCGAWYDPADGERAGALPARQCQRADARSGHLEARPGSELRHRAGRGRALDRAARPVAGVRSAARCCAG